MRVTITVEGPRINSSVELKKTIAKFNELTFSDKKIKNVNVDVDWTNPNGEEDSDGN